MKKLILAISCLLTLSATAQLNGTYTLGGVASDYPDFQSALNDLYAQGVSGPTYFDIQSGTYNETVFIDQQISFIGGFYPIQFRSATGNAADVQMNPSGTYNVVFFEQTNITFRNVTMNSNGMAFSNVWFQETDACGIMGCVLNGDAAIIRSIFARNSYSTIIEGCTLNGNGTAREALIDFGSSEMEFTLNTVQGYNTSSLRFALTRNSDVSRNYLDGSAQAATGITLGGTDNIAINNNTIVNHRTFGIRTRDDRFTGIGDNTISSNTTTILSFTGILMHQPTPGRNRIFGNTITTANPSFNRGIHLLSTGLRTGVDVEVFNNMISVGNGSLRSYGIAVEQQVADLDIFNNTCHVRTDDNAPLSAAFFADVDPSTDPASLLDVRNNIFTNFGNAYAYYYKSFGTVPVRSDLNDLYTDNANFAYFNASAFNLESFFQISGNDRNSVSVDPLYVSETDLHVSEPFLHIGNLTSGITFDIDGDPRGDGQVTLGADELYPRFDVDAGFEETVYLGYTPLECTDLTAIPTGGVSPYDYTWTTGENTQTINVCPTTERKYYVKAIDANGQFGVGIVTVKVVDVRCGNDLSNVQVCVNGNNLCVPEAAATGLLNSGQGTLGMCTGASAITATTSPVQAFPNPFTQKLTLMVAEVSGSTPVMVYDAAGAVVYTFTPEKGKQMVNINTADWKRGLYLVKHGDQMIKVVK